MRDHQRDIESTGAKILAVSFGTPSEVQDYREYFSVPVAMASDADRALYRAFGLARGTLADVYGPSAMRQHFVLRSRGYAPAPGSPKQDTFQLGGDFVVNAGGSIAFAHRGRSGEDRPPISAIVEACRRCAHDSSPTV